MKAAVYHDTQDVRIEEYDEKTVGPDDVRIDVAGCGICGSDLHEYVGGPRFTPTEPHPRSGETLPIPLGHEFSGTVSDVGENVSRLRVGDRVTIHPNIPCHECLYCEEGKYNLCENSVAVGYQTGTGGFAESAVVPAQQAHLLPDGVSMEEGALVEPLAVGLHAVRKSGMQTGDRVAVFGSGPIGLTVVQAAAGAGAKRIFVSEPKDARRERAGDLGADELIDPFETDPIERIKSETDVGVDVAFEFAGLDATFNAAVQSTTHDGTITVGSVWEEAVTTDLNDIVTTERTVTGTFCYGFPPLSFRTEFDTAIQSLAEDSIDTEPFITGRIGLGNIVEEGFEALLDEDSDHVKVLVEP